MLVTTTGIVLSSLRYSDSSVIAKVYTKDSGLGTFMVRTGKGKAALPKLGLLQPLSMVQIAYNKDDRKGIHTPKNIERERIHNTIPFDTVKTCLALFMAEVIARSIREEEQNKQLFEFLSYAIIHLDEHQGPCGNFHLKFMLEYSGYLGFYPHAYAQQRYFDLSEGEFTNTEPLHPHHLELPLTEKFAKLIAITLDKHEQVKLSGTQRRELLQKIIDYYRLHLDGMKELKSHKVLEQVLA